jgi:hypothetical protein
VQTPEYGTGWRVKVFRSVVQWPARMDLWQEWQGVLQDYDLDEADRKARALTFYLDHQREMNE